MSAKGGLPSGAWDFSKIPVFSPDRAERFQVPPLFPAQRLPDPIQAKLIVGAVNDLLEPEADKVADRAMRRPFSEVSFRPAPQQISRKCATWEEKEKFQKKPAGSAEATAREVPASGHEALRSLGQPPDPVARAFMEPRFGHDFGRIRVHSDAKEDKAARAVGSLAFTVGQHVVFAAGQHAPESEEGRALLAHELSHTIQQARAGRDDAATRPLSAMDEQDPREHAAEKYAQDALGGRLSERSQPVSSIGRTGIVLARKVPPKKATKPGSAKIEERVDSGTMTLESEFELVPAVWRWKFPPGHWFPCGIIERC
jgi:hypothetical protein